MMYASTDLYSSFSGKWSVVESSIREILNAGEPSMSLQSWVAKKSCHGQTLMNECSISDYPSKFEGL